jgi:hypothetical protein
VGSPEGLCAHEGNGYHTYAPSQAETNGDLIAFTFYGTAAIPVTVQVFTNQITYTVAGQVDANVQYINDAAVTGNGDETPWDGA